MSEQLSIYVPLIIERSFEIIVLPVSRLRQFVVNKTDGAIAYDFIPDLRIFTFRLIGKPSLGQSPP